MFDVGLSNLAMWLENNICIYFQHCCTDNMSDCTKKIENIWYFLKFYQNMTTNGKISYFMKYLIPKIDLSLQVRRLPCKIKQTL